MSGFGVRAGAVDPHPPLISTHTHRVHPMSTFEGRISLSVNGCHLQGVKRQGVWRWLSRNFPEVSLKYSGADDPCPAVEHFVRLALMMPAPAETPPRQVA